MRPVFVTMAVVVVIGLYGTGCTSMSKLGALAKLGSKAAAATGIPGVEQATIKSVDQDAAHGDTEVRFESGFGVILPVAGLAATPGETMTIPDGARTILIEPAPEPTAREIAIVPEIPVKVLPVDTNLVTTAEGADGAE